MTYPNIGVTPAELTRDYVIYHDRALARRLGLLSATFLGSGDFGDVWGTKIHAVKISGTKEEARVAKRLIGKTLPNVVRVVSVHKVFRKPIWLIRMEKLAPQKSMYAEVRASPGVSQLGDLGIKYRDLHQYNVMFDRRTRKYKLVDFGHCQFLRG
jgi:serine/threonine protein kinase